MSRVIGEGLAALWHVGMNRVCTRGVDRPCRQALASLQDVSAAWLAFLKMDGWLLWHGRAGWNDIAFEG